MAVFAHPDDEAFGPSGTIAMLSEDNDVYIICATRGETGEGDSKKLGKVRSGELLDSASILGVKEVYFLKYKDGTLANSLYHKIARDIEKIILKIKPKTLITMDPTGVSGHLDHIAMSYVSTFVFYKLPFIKTLLYWCLTEENKKLFKGEYFIYTPPGYKQGEIDKIVNIENYWQTKVKAMEAHKSQLKDASRVLDMLKQSPKEEYFIIKTK